ncbi:unnamed protein product [Soboliphyme baturini]|uniref:DUF3372 domain-containing protein n=1 Tax=Soboliphyme baturini TaxID=241478 RepID=A0A183IET9_9BILA|nr:unnamed protein product [Soboliphyme baturini]
MFAIVYWCLTVVSLMSSSRADVIRDLTPSSPVLHDNAIELRQRQRCTACEASKEAWGQDLIDQKLQLEKTKLLNKLHLTEPPGVFVNVNDIPTILVQQDPQRSLYNDYTKHPAQKEQDEIESSVFIFDKTLTTGEAFFHNLKLVFILINSQLSIYVVPSKQKIFFGFNPVFISAEQASSMHMHIDHGNHDGSNNGYS